VAYVICKRCGSKIRLIIACRHQAPWVFSAICSSCQHSDTYSFTEVIEENQEVCEKLREIKNTLIAMLKSIEITLAITNINESLKETLEKIKKKLQ
jgi:hypothetical protein